ncbi:hypothetical protein FHG64_18715 [Antarcticibacterium flavum]|uniref:Uncharacterized protein n=1 Tax=Antarcticibacterium flavum TaxID=2058175 RepID=A0A5B7X9I1_9FLAO|nr:MULTISPECIES: hypothetical protein [Antarcticibacterium]MCM4160361.1 hypothetical protein [Antarcticibacterium sp. W02-3]QCY71261.1 hypothetical protein FHG64_18715 [Antarcticibacterium flavum]
MELEKIEALLKKYEEGETTLAEESFLREYFTGAKVAPHLEPYRLLFAYTSKERTSTYPGKVEVKSKKKKFAFVGIAASIILAIGLFASLNTGQEELSGQDLGSIEDPEEAYYKTKEALQMVAAALNTGKEELIYVEEFDRAKNKYIKE